jgi:hypothetical protein
MQIVNSLMEKTLGTSQTTPKSGSETPSVEFKSACKTPPFKPV